MSRDSFVHPPDNVWHVEAPSKALQEKRQAWMEDEANLDKPMRDFLLWVQQVANEPHSGLTNRQRREWVRKERRLLRDWRFMRIPTNELFFESIKKVS
jgi:hypothetical protein